MQPTFEQVEQYKTDMMQGYQAYRKPNNEFIDVHFDYPSQKYEGSEQMGGNREQLTSERAKDLYNQLQRSYHNEKYEKKDLGLRGYEAQYRESFERPDTGERLDK